MWPTMRADELQSLQVATSDGGTNIDDGIASKAVPSKIASSDAVMLALCAGCTLCVFCLCWPWASCVNNCTMGVLYHVTASAAPLGIGLQH